MNRNLTSSLCALAFALLAIPTLAVEPPRAPTPAIPSFEVVHPTPNLWYGRFGPTASSWIDTGDGIFLVDTSASAADAKNLRAEIARTTKNKPIRWIALTHLRSDANDGFTSFLPTDATILVNERATGDVVRSVAAAKARVPHIIGVSDRITLAVGSQGFEIGVPLGNAHSAYDLYVLEGSTRTLFTGDLVVTDHCPILSDPNSDLKGWIAALEKIQALGAQALVPTRGNPTQNPAVELEKTRHYLESMLTFLVEKKKQNAPEARVSGELAGEKLGGYCPREVSAFNALAVYRRLLPDGTTRPGGAAQKPATR
jgi:glyoxylase-like metal-dependent hydrolase (beta-lactamase superfamily II)